MHAFQIIASLLFKKAYCFVFISTSDTYTSGKRPRAKEVDSDRSDVP